MVAPISQQEWEALGEAEAAFSPEGEWEAEWEGEAELGDWARRGWNWLSAPGSLQRRVALGAARAALPKAGTWIGERIGGLAGPEGVPIGGAIGGVLGSAGVSLLPDKEWEAGLEGEGEAEGEWEAEVNPVRKVYLDAMLEHMAHEAAHAESEEEAVEGFLPLIPMLAGKLLPLAGKLLPKVAGKVIPRLARVVTRVSPQLSRGVSNVTRTLYRNPRTRILVRAVPSIAQRTMRRIVRQAAAGQPVTPQAAQRVLAQQTYQVLSQPAAMQRALRRHSGMDRRYHGSTGVAPAAPGLFSFGRCPSCGRRAAAASPAPRRWSCGCGGGCNCGCACGCRR